jgi:hypothetical protein
VTQSRDQFRAKLIAADGHRATNGVDGAVAAPVIKPTAQPVAALVARRHPSQTICCRKLKRDRKPKVRLLS